MGQEYALIKCKMCFLISLSHCYILHATKIGKTFLDRKYLQLIGKPNYQTPILRTTPSSNALGYQIQDKYPTNLICLTPSFLLCRTIRFLATSEYRRK